MVAFGSAHQTACRGLVVLGIAPRKDSLPQGRKGPAFLIYQNFRALFYWSQSLAMSCPQPI